MTNTLTSRITAFDEIRDLPYYIATNGEQDCCCSTKAVRLGERLRGLGMEVRQRLCWFRWEELGLPREVLEIEHEEMPSHQFLEVLIPETGKWVMVDPTWDSKLGKILPINNWDGLSDTPCAVPVERFCTEEETVRI